MFAALALVLACIYGVMSYSVSQRTREVGIRIALGAQRSTVIWHIVRGGMAMVLAGVTLGLAVSVGPVRFVRTLLFGVSEFDPFTFSLVPAILVVVAFAACLIPARRASSVDPSAALRAG